MKRIKQKLKELIADVEVEVENRSKVQDKRGKSMSKAEKAKYMETTDRLCEMLNALNDMAVELPEN